MKNKLNLDLNKKILIISSWSPPKIGGPENLYNILSNINRNDYFILTSKQNFIDVNNNFGTKLECDYYFYDDKKNINNPNLDKKKYNFKNYILKFFSKNIIFTIKFLLIDLKNLTKIIGSGNNIIKNKKINLLIGVSDTKMNLLSTYILSKKTKIPFVLYIFDLYYGNNFNFPYNILAKIFEPLIFKNAKHILVTNDETKKYYIKKYGNENKYSIIYNSVFHDKYTKYNSNQKLDHNNKLNIVFTGNIYWAQKSTLDNLLNLIKNKLNINITIYCPNPPIDLIKKYSKCKKITFKSEAQAEMPKIQSEADILFLPLSWNTGFDDIIKTASPGKLSDYLIAGRPILINAPDFSFISKYAIENNFAEVVDKEDPEMLKLAIEKIANNKKYVNILVENAKKTFYKNHNAYDNSLKFQKIINNK